VPRIATDQGGAVWRRPIIRAAIVCESEAAI
jgi:hypothetical protein